MSAVDGRGSLLARLKTVALLTGRGPLVTQVAGYLEWVDSGRKYGGGLNFNGEFEGRGLRSWTADP